jgi:hypothetical protein
MTYFTAPGNGGGVFASGSAYFLYRLSNSAPLLYPNVLPRAIPGVTDILLRAMENLYSRFGLGPATAAGSSSGNWSSVYAGATTVGTAVPTNSA